MKIITWFLAALFLIIGVLNAWLVHPAPGMLYLLLAVLFLPQTDALLKKKLGLTIPLALKIFAGLVILWGTLAIGDLVEILGF